MLSFTIEAGTFWTSGASMAYFYAACPENSHKCFLLFLIKGVPPFLIAPI